MLNKKDFVIQQVVMLSAAHSDIEVAWLYGSRARNTHNQKSDYDLAIAFKNFIADPLDSRLRPELLASNWQHIIGSSCLQIKLSVIDINLAPIALCYTVLVDDKPLYIANEMRKLQEENRIMSQWELDYEYSRKKYH